MTEPSKSGSSASLRTQRRRVARLAACQALYEIELSGISPDAALRDFIPNRWNMVDEDDGASHPDPLPEPDGDLLCAVVRGVSDHHGALDGMIASLLAESWSSDRLEVLMRSILRAGAFELLGRKDIPARVVISEYVEVAKAFFAGTEPGMVNAVLDRLAHTLRPEEMGGEGGSDGGPAGR